jgi:hypothetical protein
VAVSGTPMPNKSTSVAVSGTNKSITVAVSGTPMPNKSTRVAVSGTPRGRGR